MSIFEGLATLIGNLLTREPTASPVLTKCWKSELMLATNFDSLCPKVTEVGSQNFGNQIWFCTKVIILEILDKILDITTAISNQFRLIHPLELWK